MADSNLKLIFGLFVALLLGIVLIQVIATSIAGTDDIHTSDNESMTITSSAGQVRFDELTTVTFFGNGSNSTAQSDVVINTHVNWTEDGDITVGNDIFSDGVYNITYNYEGDLYVSNGTSRTLLGLVVLFFAVYLVVLASISVKNFIDKIY